MTNPPTYESQASYLLRLGLLGAPERRRLRPTDVGLETIALDEG